MVNSIARRVARNGVQTAPDYEEPIDDDPIAPPVGEPTEPTDTPLDADNDNEPEPGFDADYVAPDRIEIVDNKQTVVRTETDPGTWGNAYVASALTGPEYWEVEVAASTPNNATLAIGVSTLAMPLNGIPGALAGTIAYWSDGTVRQNGETLMTLATYGRKDRIGVSYDADGGVRLFKNCVALNSGAIVGSVTGSPRYPFVGLYSANSRTAFKFALSKFGCTIADDFYPIGQIPPPPAQTVFFEDFTSPQMFESGASLRHVQTSSARRSVSFDTAPSASDQEVLAALVVANSSERWGVILRGGGTSSTNTGYVIEGSSTVTGAAFGLVKYVSGAVTSFDHDTGPRHVAGRRFWLRARIEGTALKFKVWLRDREEPASWGYEATDTDISGSGYAGLFSLDGAGGGKYCEYFGVGNGGASAPGPDDTPGANQYATDFSAVDALDAWTQRWSSTVTTLSRVTTATDIPPLDWQVGWFSDTISATPDDYLIDTEKLRTRGRNTAYRMLYNNKVHKADAEILTKVSASLFPGDYQHYVALRASQALDVEGIAYLFGFASGRPAIFKRLSTGTTNLTGSGPFAASVDVDYWLRFRVEGSALKAKIWADPATEPSSWTFELTDTDITTAGLAGIGSRVGFQTGSGTALKRWGVISIDAAGGTAPLTDPDA